MIDYEDNDGPDDDEDGDEYGEEIVPSMIPTPRSSNESNINNYWL